MHAKGIRLFPRMTKAMIRRQIVRFTELCFWMAVLSIGGIITALLVSECLKLLGVG